MKMRLWRGRRDTTNAHKPVANGIKGADFARPRRVLTSQPGFDKRQPKDGRRGPTAQIQLFLAGSRDVREMPIALPLETIFFRSGTRGGHAKENVAPADRLRFGL